MVINGYNLSQWQRCKRPHVIGRTHTFSKWRPQSLLGACLRHAIFNLSNGKALESVASTAVSHFISAARNPGLDIVGVDTYKLTMDYCAIIRNILEYLSRTSLLCLKDLPEASLTKNLSWQFLSQRDESGVLHRWKFVDYIPEDLTAELHSWEVSGDIAVGEMPMMLHLIGIGKRDSSHQSSPWCRIYAHPNLANVYRFQKKAGNKLEGDWKPIWFSDGKNKPKDWVDLMMKDNVVGGLIKHISIKEFSDEHRQLHLRDIGLEGEMMASAWMGKVSPRALPMSKYACDNPYTCPHQFYCYNTALTLDNSGLYKPKEVANAVNATA